MHKNKKVNQMRIKSLLTTLFLLIISSIKIFAAPLYNVERILTQPDGSKLYCFISGDEFYNRLHDANGFTIVQADNGYFVYADMDRNGKIVATQHVAGKADPKMLGLQPNIMISQEEYLQRRKAKEVPALETKDVKNLNHGMYNNLIVYIKFQGDEDMTTTKTEIDSMFNNDGYYDISMNNYFKKATYNQLSMRSYSFPEPEGDKIIAYEDIYPRNYYQPYNPTTNPEGYHDQAEREFPLLKRAIESIADQVPDTLDIDRNNDGMVDNVIFVVKGNVGDWSDLLWPHMWSLIGEEAYIHGKRVWTFNFQLETSSNFSVSTLCHEMSHSLGFPDLYHYLPEYDNLSPSGSWDIMCSNSNPPQHTATYMKYKYGTWIDDIPEIGYGTYTLEANSWEGGRRNCYKIPSSDPNQFYLLEYRNKNNLFEKGLPSHGLLIYRIDTRFRGCVDYNGYDIFDEVYIFRPGGSQTQNGTLNAAAYSKNVNKTVFNHTTNPYPFLNADEIDENINICNISEIGDQITFTYCPVNTEIVPQNLLASVIGTDLISLEWDAVESAESYNIYRNGELWKTEVNNYCNDGNELEDGYYEYYVTANCNGEESYRSNKMSVILGDYCGYMFNMTTTGENGWQGSEIKLSFDNGMDDVYYTIYSGQFLTKDIVLPIGTNMTVEWISGWDDSECMFTITQGDELIYDSYTQGLQEGVLLELEASGERSCVVPQNLIAKNNGTGVYLKWTSMVESEGYDIVRNGEIIANNVTETEFLDTNIPTSGLYIYNVMSVNDNCASAHSNEAYAMVFTYTVEEMSMNATSVNDSIAVSWETPTVPGGNIQYDNGEFAATIECSSNRSWAIKIDAENLSAFETNRLKAVELYDTQACELTFKIYNGETTHDSTLIHTEVYNTEGTEDFVMINLSEEVPYDSNKDLWITVKPSSMYSIACTEYIKEQPNSCLMKVGSSWNPIIEYGQYYSWMLRAYTSVPDNAEWNYTVINNGVVMASEITENQVIIPIEADGEQCLEVHAYYQDLLYTNAELCIEAFINVEENNDDMLQIYPNPAKNILYLNAENIQNVKIFSLVGVTLYEQNVNDNSLNINIEGLSDGLYIIQVKTSNGIITKPIVINKD